jgi:hypothetical protein
MGEYVKVDELYYAKGLQLYKSGLVRQGLIEDNYYYIGLADGDDNKEGIEDIITNVEMMTYHTFDEFKKEYNNVTMVNVDEDSVTCYCYSGYTKGYCCHMIAVMIVIDKISEKLYLEPKKTRGRKKALGKALQIKAKEEIGLKDLNPKNK